MATILKLYVVCRSVFYIRNSGCLLHRLLSLTQRPPEAPCGQFHPGLQKCLRLFVYAVFVHFLYEIGFVYFKRNFCNDDLLPSASYGFHFSLAADNNFAFPGFISLPNAVDSLNNASCRKVSTLITCIKSSTVQSGDSIRLMTASMTSPR